MGRGREEGLGKKRGEMGNFENCLRAYMTPLELKRENLYGGRKQEEGGI